MRPFVQTASGIHFHWLNEDCTEIEINPDEICIEDIAAHLSKQCRFLGAPDRFYSVAEHSVLCSLLVPGQYRLHALLHDAAETYTGDFRKPWKTEAYYRVHNDTSDSFVSLSTIERIITLEILRKFNVPLYTKGHEVDIEEAIKAYDAILLATEGAQLMGDTTGWGLEYEPIPKEYLDLGGIIINWETAFIQLFEYYQSGKDTANTRYWQKYYESNLEQYKQAREFCVQQIEGKS